jgi:hypothetical protein
MTHLVTFTSSQFDVAAETPNPINPIAGESVLKWLRERLLGDGYEITEPEPEDWGWFIYVKKHEMTYLIGASSDVDESDPREWIIQIHRQRSLKDKLLGQNKLVESDALSSRIERIVRESPGFQYVQVDKGA